MFDCFYQNYIALQYGAALPVTHFLFVIGLIIIITDIKCNPKSIACFMVKMIIALLFWILLYCGYTVITSRFGGFYDIYIVSALYILVCLLAHYRVSAYDRVIFGCMYYSTYMAANQLAAMSATWLRSVFQMQDSNLITILVVFSMIAVIILILKEKKIKKEEQNWYTIVTVTLAALLVSFQSWIGSSEENAFYLSISALFLWVFEIYIFLLIISISKSSAQKIKMVMEISLRKNIDESLKINENNVKEMRALNHDLKKHFMIMDTFIREEKYDELKSYFEEVSAQTLSPLSSVACGNDIIRMIVNLGVDKALYYGVKLNVKIAVADSLPFLDSDLNCLLMNLIDNAIEGCKRCPPEQAVIDLRLSQDDNYFYICIQNHVSGDEEKDKYSEEESKLHGYGSKIIDRIVAKYNGIINRDTDDKGIYKIQIALDCNSPSADQAL